MIKCKYPTEAKKLGAIAATYRSGDQSIFSTCPTTCPLLPKPKEGSVKLDQSYLAIEQQAVPRKGHAWSYTHFSYQEFEINESGTTINISTDTPETALASINSGFPTVYAAPVGTQWPQRIEGRRFIQCPAETNKRVTCQTCGGGIPLCARRNRDYIIVFVAHGSTKANVGLFNNKGCYAANGRTLLQWESTMNGIGPTTWDENKDPERLLNWVSSLPIGTLLRHRISGDLGETT